ADPRRRQLNSRSSPPTIGDVPEGGLFGWGHMGAGDDLPMISPSSDSTQVDITPQKEVRVNAPDARRTPATEAPKPASAPAVPAGRGMAPSSSWLPPTQHANDPRKASDPRSPGPRSPAKPAPAAPAPPPGH